MSDPFTPPADPAATTPAATPATPATDPFADKLGMIVNADGQPKYKDTGSALTALSASQTHISTLEQERAADAKKIADLEAEVARRASVEDAVARLATPPVESPAATPTSVPAGLDEATVTQLVQNQLAAASAQSAAATNRATVVDAVSKVHGENAAKFIQEKAAAVGTTAANLGKLAETNPQMAFAILGELKAPTQPVVPVTPTQAGLPKVDNAGAPVFAQSSARGGLSAQENAERWAQVREYTNKQLGIVE